jgi:hypothetical protein
MSPQLLAFAKTSSGDVSADGRAEISDNGGGLGPQQGCGRWAVMIDGRWIANVDYLPAAKQMAAEILDEAGAR